MDLLERTSAVAGAGLAGATRAVAVLRRAQKPLHPRGELVTAQLRRTGSVPATGVAWLDGSGTDEVLVRRSRAVGWSSLLPDVHGMAVRVPVGEGHGDLLLATTGLGRATRHLLLPGWGASRPMTTLLPYTSGDGPLLVAARARGTHEYELAHATRGGTWRTFAVLTLATTGGADPLVSFDPVVNSLPGLAFPAWVARLREPAYLTARRSRSAR